MSAGSANETRENSPGTRQVLAFFLVALSVGVPGLLLGGPVVGYFAFLLFGLLFVIFFSGDKRRLFLVVYLLLAAGLLIGGLTYSRLTSKGAAAQISSLPLIGWLLKYAAVKVGLALLTGLIGGLLAVGLPLFLIIFVSAEWMLALRQTYDLDHTLAMKLLLYLALGIDKTVVIADDGEIKDTKPKGPLDKFGAPAVVLVKPYNAVVLEQGGKVTRIEGAGLVTLQKHEVVKAVVDLRAQGESFEMEALTKDNVPLKVSGSALFRIESWQEARDRGDEGDFETKGFTGVISGPYPVYRRTLYRAVYGVRSDKDWKSQTAGVARGKIAAEIQKLRLDEIFVIDEDERVRMERSALLDIVDQAKPEAIEITRIWGVNVLSVGIGSIEMPEEAQEEFLRRWGAPWRGWRDLIEAEAKRQVAIAEAQGEQEAIKLRADAKRWRVIGEALAELEAADHKADRDLLVAQTREAIAQAKGKATVMNAEARAKATEIEADAEGRAEAQRIEQLARALVRALGPQGAKEILKEMAKQKVSLAQMRRLLGVINLSRRALEGGPGMGSSEEDEMTQE